MVSSNIGNDNCNRGKVSWEGSAPYSPMQHPDRLTVSTGRAAMIADLWQKVIARNCLYYLAGILITTHQAAIMLQFVFVNFIPLKAYANAISELCEAGKLSKDCLTFVSDISKKGESCLSFEEIFSKHEKALAEMNSYANRKSKEGKSDFCGVQLEFRRSLPTPSAQKAFENAVIRGDAARRALLSPSDG